MSWWDSLFHKSRLDAQLTSEVRFHIEELTDANIAAGMSPQEARRKALLEFGGGEQVREELRDVHRVAVVETAVANFKFAFRFMRKSPSFAVTVILTLALAIGANSAVFSAIDAILLRPLPFPNGDQLVELNQRNTKTNDPQTRLAPIRIEDWNRMNSTFQAITGYYAEDTSETSGPLPEKIREAFVAPRFLQVWGIAPELGRDFSPEEERYGGPAAALISDRFWRQRFAADPSALGKKLRINGYAQTIVGIMPASFLFQDRDVDVWCPVPPDDPVVQNRAWTWDVGIGRLKPDVTLAQARANLATVQTQLGTAFPKTDAQLVVGVQPLKEKTVSDARRSLWMLYGSVSLLLLIACINIVALLLARDTQRKHEIAIRFSLGAPRVAIVTQLLTETFVLAFLGTAAGLVVAAQASQVFRKLAANLPRVEEIRLDVRIVLYSLACAVVTTLLCGLFPALRGTRRNLAGSLSKSGRGQVSGRNPVQWLLVGTQVALAVTLLAGAGLLLRSFQALGRVSPGFEASHVLTFHISASYAETADWKGLTQRIDRTVDALRNLPGVASAAVSSELPGVPAQYPTEIKIVDGEQDPERKMIAESRFISPYYFATMQIPLLSGEPCREPKMTTKSNSGGASGLQVEISAVQVLVNRSFEETYLGGSSAVGHHVQVVGNALLSANGAGEIRGVVGDAREEGMNRAPEPTVYWCFGAPGGPDPYYLVRGHGAPRGLARTVREKVHELEPARSVFDVMPLEEHIDDAFAENRLRTVLLAFFAGTAIALACVGLYGTLSYSVTVRQQEVGLRLALGALRGEIVRQFLLQGLKVTVLGCLAGWVLAAASGRLLSGMLYGVSSSDSVTLASVVLGVLLVAAMACLVPALRASRLDPMRVLREE
jgi:putative ABC transport system permease protein